MFFIVPDTLIHFDQQLYMYSELWGYFRQFLGIQLNRQPNRQTVKLRTATSPAQQLFIHSSFPWTASHRQPKQTGPKWTLPLLYPPRYLASTVAGWAAALCTPTWHCLFRSRVFQTLNAPAYRRCLCFGQACSKYQWHHACLRANPSFTDER
jgi:hypothetical protein